MCNKRFVGVNFFSQGKKVMASGLENTSNAFVGNSNIRMTENATKRLRYILLLKMVLFSLRHVHAGVDIAHGIWGRDMTPGSEQ